MTWRCPGTLSLPSAGWSRSACTISMILRAAATTTNEAAYEQAQYILQEEMDEFYAWLNGRDLIPRIQEIQQDAVTDLNLRIRKIIRKLPMGRGQIRKNC